MLKSKKLTTNDVAEKFGKSVVTVTNWCNAGLFPGAQKVEYPRGSIWEIPVDAVSNFKPPKRGRKLVDAPSDFALAKRRQRERDAKAAINNAVKENKAA